MKEKVKKGISFLLAVGMVLTSVLPAQAYTKPQEAEAQLQNGYSENSSEYQIFPIPQKVTYEDQEFQITDEVNVVYEEGIDSYTKAFLEEVLANYGRTVIASTAIDSSKSNILLGIEGSNGAADAWTDVNSSVETEDLFEQTDAYLLDAQNGTIAIVGKDTEAAYYGVATLQMMFSSFAGEKFLNAEIEDYASMAIRGFIEGFYGGWNYDERESLMRFARDYKMNTYVYASKTDSYHKNDTLYPSDDITKIAELVKIGKETKVEYAWSVHISYFFNRLANLTVGSDEYNTAFDTNYASLKKKFQQLYDAGVRKFDILNDDFGSGTHAEVVRLLNKLDEDFIQANGCERLTYCPQGYNESWSTAGELEALKELNDTIDIYWTGADVNSPITQSTVNFLKEKTGHEPVFWLNYPVNEHGASGVYLGNITHYARDGVTGLAGAVSNPCRFAEANKVGLFQLAALFWNNNDYLEKADEIWEESFKYLQPEVYDAYLTIARNVANCPNSSRVSAGFPESEYLKEKLENILADQNAGASMLNNTEADEVLVEFEHILEAVDTFRSECENAGLTANLEPWLNSLVDVVTAAKAALNSLRALEDDDVNEAWKQLGAASKAMDTYDMYPTYSGSDKMALAGSKRLVPFANKMIAAAKNALIPYLNPSSSEFTPSFYAVLGGQEIGDGTESAKIFDGDETTYGTFQKVQQLGDYFGVDLGRTIAVHSISILQGQNDTHHDYFHNGCLEYSTDGETWTTIAENVDARRMSITDIYINARYIRLRLTKVGTASKSDYWTYIREISVNAGKEESYGAISNVDDLADVPVVMEDKTYSMSALENVQLGWGEYLGIKMKEIAAIESIDWSEDDEEGLILQYSENGLIWEDVPESLDGINARYVRIVNVMSEVKTFSLWNMDVTVESVSIHPQVIESSFAQLKEGNWENLFDSNTSTYAWTNTAQRIGQYILVDLGATAPVYDLKITTEDGNPRFYNAKIQVSTDKTTWEDIAEVVDGGGDAVRENIFYHITKDLEGKQVRYIKILLTGDSGYYLKICDIDINKTVEYVNSEISGNISGDLEKMIDGDISTVYAADAASDGTSYVEYKITENNYMHSVTFLQDANNITNAEVTAKLAVNGNGITTQKLGTLDAGSNTFELDANVLSFKITWPEGTTPVMYEIITSRNDSSTGNEEETVFPTGKQVYTLASQNADAVTVLYGTALGDVELPETIAVTYGDATTETLPLSWTSDEYQPYQAGTYTVKGYPVMPEGAYNHAGLYVAANVTVGANPADGDSIYPDVENGNLVLNVPVSESGSGLQAVENAVDGDTETRWEGNAIKGGSSTTTSWIMMDLGPNKEISATQVNVSFYLKTYATDYDVQVSEDGEEWTTLATQTNEDGDTKDPVDTITLETPITQRYVRLFFRSMNANAAGHAVGIREVEIIGSRTSVAVCSCKITGLTVQDQTIEVLPIGGEMTINLTASARLAGNCQKEDHAGSNITYEYAIVEDNTKSAVLTGDKLTVKDPGTITLVVTASAPGTDARPVKKTFTVEVTWGCVIPPDWPDNVTGLTAAVNKTKSITISWEKAKYAQGYKVSRYDTATGTWKEIAKTTELTVTDTGLKAATAYKYRVSAYADYGMFVMESSEATELETATAPVKTKMKLKKVGNGKVKLTWNKKAKADGFEIYMQKGKKVYKRIASKGKKVVSLKKGGLKKGITYRFKLRSYKKVGNVKVYSAFSKAKKVKF